MFFSKMLSRYFLPLRDSRKLIIWNYHFLFSFFPHLFIFHSILLIFFGFRQVRSCYQFMKIIKSDMLLRQVHNNLKLLCHLGSYFVDLGCL